MERIILGIDISTTCLGLCLVRCTEDDMEVMKLSHVKLKTNKKVSGTELLFLKSKQFREEFIIPYSNVGITDIVIEEPLPNSMNTNTVATLLRFNGMISQSIYEATGIVPKYISSYDARRFGFPELIAVRKYNKSGEEYDYKKIKRCLKKQDVVLFGSYPYDCAKKHILQERVASLYPDINWCYNSKGELKNENFDASDAFVCVVGYLNKEKYGDTQPLVTDVEEFDIEVDGTKVCRRINYKLTFCGSVFEKSIDTK